MRSALSQRASTPNINLQNIREKVAELKQQQSNKKNKTTYNGMYQDTLHEKNLRIVVNRQQELLNKRKTQLMKSKINFNNDIKNSSHLIKVQETQTKNQIERVVNFLRAHSSKDKCWPNKTSNKREKINNQLEGEQNEDDKLTKQEKKQIQQQLRIFTPLRPISRHQKMQDAVSSSSRSLRVRTLSRKSSFMKFQQLENPQVSKKQKYLRKGSRVRQLLLKQLNIPVTAEDQQLAYLKDYDQWVPISFVSLKKQQLQRLMEIYMGGKKKQEQDTWKVNGKYPMFYL